MNTNTPLGGTPTNTPISERLLKTLSGAAAVLFFLFLGLKGCVVTVWLPPQSAQYYVVVGADRRVLEITIFPDREVILWYTDPNRNYFEGSLQSWKGTEGTHYFSRLWKIESGYRLYPSGFTPVAMEQTTVKTFRSGAGSATFPEEGERGDGTILFSKSKDSLIFAGMTLKQAALDPTQLELRKALLGKMGNGANTMTEDQLRGSISPDSWKDWSPRTRFVFCIREKVHSMAKLATIANQPSDLQRGYSGWSVTVSACKQLVPTDRHWASQVESSVKTKMQGILGQINSSYEFEMHLVKSANRDPAQALESWRMWSMIAIEEVSDQLPASY